MPSTPRRQRFNFPNPASQAFAASPHADQPDAAERTRARTRRWLAVAALAATLGARAAQGAITPTPSTVSLFPTQTSGVVTLNITFSPPTWSGTNTITFTTALGPLPTWLTVVPPVPTFSYAAGATSATTTFRFQASNTATVGSLNVIMTPGGGTPPAGIGSGNITVQILQPSYTATAAPNPVAMPWGGSRTVTVTTAADPGFTPTIVYSFTGFPAGITWGTAQATMSPTYAPLMFTFGVAAGTAPGTYNGTLSAASSVNKTFPMTVVVQPPDITMSFTLPSINVCNGGPPVSDGITLTPMNGFAGTPKMSVTAPPGVTVTPTSFPIAPMPPGQTIPFQVSASGAMPGPQTVTFRVIDSTAGIDKTASFTVAITDPDYTPGVTPASVTLVPGGAAQNLTAALTPNPCFSASTVTATPSGAPAGVSFTPPTVTLVGPAYAGATLAVLASPSTVPGTYPITVTFQAPAGSTKTVPATLVVTAAPDFTLAVAPPSLSLAPGASGTGTVSATGVNGFTGSITVAAPTLAGVTFTPASFALTPGGSQVVTVQVATVATPGTVTATFTGTVIQMFNPHTASFALTILPPPDFALTVAPQLLPVAAGTSGSVAVTATALNGFAGSVSVVAPTLPGVTFAPAAFSLAAGGSQTVAVQVAPGTAPGDLLATFTGTAVGVAAPRTALLTLRVTAPPDFTLSVTPTALALVQGSSGTVTVSVAGVNGFAGTVAVTAPTLAGVTLTPASFSLAAGASQPVIVSLAPTASPGTFAAQFAGTAAGVSGARSVLLTLTVAPAPPVITTVTPPTMTVGATNMVLRLAGENFRPGATVTCPDPALQIVSTKVISSTVAEVVATLGPGARSGPYRLDLVNTDGTRTSQGVLVLVYPLSSIAAPLGVTTAAIVFPRPYTLLAPDAPLYPRGLLATTGLGAIIGAWRYDGVPFDRFTVNVSGGMPVEVKANVPIPVSYTGEHKLELAIEQPQSLVTEPVSIIQSLESRSGLEILAPPDNTAFGERPPLFRWSLVPGASGYEVEIEMPDHRPPVRVRLSESEWRPSADDVEAIGPGVHRYRVKAIFPGETSGEPTPWRRFAIPPKRAELKMLSPATDPATGRPAIRWEGGGPGLVYRVEFFLPGSDAPFAAAFTMRQRYLVPPGVTQRGAALRVRVVALGPDGSPRGAAAPADLAIQSSLIGVGRDLVLASAGAQVTALTPPDGATLTEDRPVIEVRWSGAVKPEEVLLTVDATDVTAVAAVGEGSIWYASVEPLAAGAHVLQLSLAGAITRTTFIINPPPPAEAAAAAAQAEALRRDWQYGLMGNGTETDDEGHVHGDAGRLQLTGQTEIGSGESVVKATADLGGRREFEPPYRTVSESQNWQFHLGATQPGFKEEGRFGYSPPDFLDQSEFLAAGLARGGGQAKIGTPIGSISYYQTFAAESAGATGAPSVAQDLKGIGYQAPWDPTRFLLRAVALRSEGEVGPENAGVRGEAAGVFTRLVLGAGLTLLFEGAYSKTTPQGAESPPERGGYGLHLGAMGMLGTLNYAVNLRKTQADFSNPMNVGLTPGAVPDRVGGDVMLSTQLGSASVSVQLRRLESGGGSAEAPPKATENGAMLSLAVPLRSNLNLAVSGTWTGNEGEAAPDLYLPAVSRTQRGMTLTLTEVPGRLMLSQALAWQEMLDDNMPAANQTVKSVTLSANGPLTPAITLAGLASGTRSESAPPVGKTDQLMLSLQPTINWTQAFLSVTPRAAWIEVKSEMSAGKTTTEQYQVLLQLTPPWVNSLLAFQVAADWSRTTMSAQSPAPGYTRRIVGTVTLRANGQRMAPVPPVAPFVPVAGAGWIGPPSPTLGAIRL